MSSIGSTPSHQRLDIQALRGLAVLLVVIYHARLGGVPSGYLGVDVFFVISGFLITSQIATGLSRGDFSFGQFYFRRAKRLLPAAYVVLAATWLAAPWVLGPGELKDLQAQVWGTLTFTGNLVLWKQSGYFQGAAELKPLLHVWSLAIEEQYYLLLPALLALLPRRAWLPVVAGITVLSLAACMALQGRDAAFYLLPFRAWEMLLGSLIALAPARPRLQAGIQALARPLFWPALALLLVLPLAPRLGAHPGPAALLICLATVLVIARAQERLFEARALRPLVRLGDWSYSLYLVHWPVFAFLNNIWLPETPPPLALRLALLLLCLLLAVLLHHGVERPVRSLQLPRRRLLAPLAVGSGLLALVPLWLPGAAASSSGPGSVGSARAANRGFDAACDFKTLYVPSPECQSAPAPEVLVWGDSFAMHLLPGLAAEGRTGLAQATRAVCGPMLGLSVIRERERGRGMDWARQCVLFSQSVLDQLGRMPSVRVVILSSPFDQFTNAGETQIRWNGDTGAPQRIPASVDEALAAMGRSVQALRAMGKKVVVVAPPPMGGFDVGRCHERQSLSLPFLGVPSDCRITRQAYVDKRARVLEFLDRLPAAADVALIRFDDQLCDAEACRTTLDGTFVYRDGGHLSRAGSVLMAQRLDLLNQAQALAR